MDSIIVIDDVISRGYQSFIEKMAKDFPWYFLDQVTDSDYGSNDTATGFSYEILLRRQEEEKYNKTPYADALVPLLCEAIHKVDKNQDGQIDANDDILITPDDDFGFNSGFTIL